MILLAFAFPMPLSSKSSLEVALFMSTTANRYVILKNKTMIYFKILLPHFKLSKKLFGVSIFMPQL